MVNQVVGNSREHTRGLRVTLSSEVLFDLSLFVDLTCFGKW